MKPQCNERGWYLENVSRIICLGWNLLVHSKPDIRKLDISKYSI